MLASADDVYDRVRTRIGTLARQLQRDNVAPQDSDTDALRQYLEDAITTICTDTDRMATVVSLETVVGQPYVERPPYIDRVDRASLTDSGSAFVVERKDGRDLAQWGRNPAATQGRPEYIGGHDGKFYLFPVPDDTYPLELVVTYNGLVVYEAPDNPTVQDPPTLDTMVDTLPSDFRKAIVSQVVGRWFEDIGEPEVAQREKQRFYREVEKYEEEPVSNVTSTRGYNILE